MATYTTSLRPNINAEHKKQPFAQHVGCCCAQQRCSNNYYFKKTKLAKLICHKTALFP